MFKFFRGTGRGGGAELGGGIGGRCRAGLPGPGLPGLGLPGAWGGAMLGRCRGDRILLRGIRLLFWLCLARSEPTGKRCFPLPACLGGGLALGAAAAVGCFLSLAILEHRNSQLQAFLIAGYITPELRLNAAGRSN